jgi:hypothetical protein
VDGDVVTGAVVSDVVVAVVAGALLVVAGVVVEVEEPPVSSVPDEHAVNSTAAAMTGTRREGVGRRITLRA